MGGPRPYVRGIAHDDKNLYYSTNYSDLCGGDGAIVKMPLDGSTSTQLISDLCFPESVAVDGTSIYWTSLASDAGNSQTLAKASLEGGPVTVLATGVVGAIVDGTSVYTTAYDSSTSEYSLLKIPVNGGQPEVLTSTKSCEGLVVGATNLYWWTGNDLMTVPIVGGASARLWSSPTPGQRFHGLALDAKNIYFTDDGSLLRMSIDGGIPTVLASAGSYCILVDATSVYYVNIEGRLMSVPIEGGAPVAITDPPPSDNCPIAVDSTSLYFRQQVTFRLTGFFKVTPK